MNASAFSVDTVPRGYPAQLIPDGPVRILGGMRTGDRITAVFADSTRKLAAHAEDMFTRSGFARPPVAAGSGFMTAGGPYAFFCGDSATVSAHPLPGPDGILRVEYRKYRGRLGCPVHRSPPTERKRLRLPELVPPAGVRLGRTGGGGGSDEVNSRAEASGARLDPAMLLSHFGGQLVAAGWRGGAPALGERVAAQHYRATDDAGDAWEGTLVAIGDSANVTLNLSMRRRPAP